VGSTGITEIWRIDYDVPFLDACILWGEPRPSSDAGYSKRFGMTPLLAVHVACDDLWITTAEQIFDGLAWDHFSGGRIIYHFYDSRKK
jgi:hypothetical protein